MTSVYAIILKSPEISNYQHLLILCLIGVRQNRKKDLKNVKGVEF